MHSCPQCGDTVKNEQKFCSNCGLKFDSSIFDQEGIICTGQNDDGTACGRQLSKNVKFCPDCATPVKKEDADVPVSDSNLFAVDKSLTLQNLQNTIGPTDSEVKQHNNGITHSTEQEQEGQTVPNQNVSEDSMIKNNDVANGNRKQIPSSTDSVPSDPQASVILVADQQTPEPNAEHAEGQKKNPDSTPESQEQASKSKSASEDHSPESKSSSKRQTQDNPTGQEQIPDSDSNDSKPFSHEQEGSNRDEDKMEVSPSQPPGSKIKTCQTQNDTEKLKLANESDSSRFQESSIKEGPVTTQPHSVFGSDKNQDKTTVSETTTDSPPGPDKNQDKTIDSETTDFQAGPGSERFKDSFIFGEASNDANPSYFKGESSSQKGDKKGYEGREDGLKEKDKAGQKSAMVSEKEEEQDEETSADDSSDSKDSDSEKSDEDGKTLPASQKRKKDRKKNKKIKEEKKKERKKKKSSKKENPSNSQSDLGNTNASAKGPKSGSSRQRNSGKTSETTQGATAVDKAGGRRHTSYSSIEVYFHVVIVPTLLENPDKDSVVIEFDKNTRSGEEWNKKQFKVKLDRSSSDEYTVGSVMVTIPKYLISESNGLFYNYSVDHGKGQDNCISEYFHIAGMTLAEKGYKRYLKIPIKDYSTGVYHKYDGVAREDPRLGKSKNLWHTVKDTVKKFVGFDDYYTVLKDDAKRSVSLFHPKWQLNSLKTDGLNGEEMMCQVVNINEGLRSVYVQQMKLIDGTVFDGLFAKALIPPMKKIIHQLENMKKDKLDAEGKTLHLVTAVTVTHTVVTFEVGLEVKERRMLCEALLPCPDYDTKTSPDVEELKTFLSTDLKKVTDSVLKFSRGIAEKTSDPSWLYCVPVIHFLLKKCKPFENAPSKINHDDREPEWWGIVEYKKDIDHFKYKSKWDRPADQVVKKLTPYFEVDYLLPRTFLGSLNLDMLYSIVTANSIPPDISLASTCYYIKGYNSNKELIKKLAKHVARKSISENLDMSTPGLTNAYRTYRIAANLLEESLKFRISNEPIHLPAIEVFLKSSDAYDKIQNKLDLNKNEYKQINISKDGHLRKLEDFKGRIVHWLSEDIHYKELDFLKRWNSALKMKIPEGNIKESYAKHLQERLQGMLENKGSDEKLIEIYCEHTESFDGTIQEILSKVALKAVNKCDSFDWRNQKDERCNMRLGKLLSSVFERSWDIRKLDDPHEVLHHAITWGPFPTYMEMYCSIRKALTEECQNLLKRFEEVIQSFIVALIQGNISIKILRKLTSRSVSFQKILIAMKNENSETIMKTLTIRSRELEAFDNTYQIVQEFTYVCIHCKADTALLETKLKIFNAPDMVSLNKLVKTVLLENLKDPENYRPIVIVFDLCPEELDILPKILECCKSFLFMKIWEKKGLEQQNEERVQITG
ncbi:unnamed protein product [Mytilus coruscus]|uniref:RNF213 n=1 Tax=Mytilus coruscus TaxID=42192 RepID=A0A6J8EJW0_MYTCO|nr:unnamed protein product [Mytilus coruscus]